MEYTNCGLLAKISAPSFRAPENARFPRFFGEVLVSQQAVVNLIRKHHCPDHSFGLASLPR